MSLGNGPTNEGRPDVDTIPPQPTVMVMGRDERQLRSVATGLFEQRASSADGVVTVTTRTSPSDVARRLTGAPVGFDRDRLAVVDAQGEREPDAEVGHLSGVEDGADPDAVADAVETSLERLADAGVERRHFLYDALPTDPRLADGEAAYDRAYRIAMTVGAEEGLALFVIEDGHFSPDVVERLGHLFDVRVELREFDGRTQLRWTGLLGASDDWVRREDVDLGVGGFR